MQIKNRRRFGTLKATFGRDFGTIGCYFGCSGTPWRASLDALGRYFGCSGTPWGLFLALFGTRKEKKHERELLRVEWPSVWGPFWGAFWHILAKINVFLSDVFQIGFFIDFGALRDPPGPQKTSKTIVGLHENKVLQKLKKVPAGSHFGSILGPFWRTFSHFLWFFDVQRTLQKNIEKKSRKSHAVVDRSKERAVGSPNSN